MIDLQIQRNPAGGPGFDNAQAIGKGLHRHSTSDAIDTLLARLDKVRETGSGTWLACCPAHGDRNPSLSIKQASDGTILLHCFAGCGGCDIAAAVGLELRDLFPNDGSRYSGPKRRFERRPAPLDALRAINHEALIVNIIASDIINNGSVDNETMERLAVATGRIGAARALYE